jgi:hypothetical protein
MFDIEVYLDLPEDPKDCIYENCRNKILLGPEVFTRVLKHEHKVEMKNIHVLHLGLYEKYGEDWVDNICFLEENLRSAIKLVYPKEYSGKEAILSRKSEMRELYKQERQQHAEIAKSKYYMIKILNCRSDNRVWLGWSNAGDALGFYHTDNKTCKVFSEEILKGDKELCQYLQGKEYAFVPVEDVSTIRKSRFYQDYSIAKPLTLTREMIVDICENVCGTTHNAKNGLCFKVVENLDDIISGEVDGSRFVYSYNDDESIVVVVDNIFRTEVEANLILACGGFGSVNGFGLAIAFSFICVGCLSACAERHKTDERKKDENDFKCVFHLLCFLYVLLCVFI